MAKEKEFLCLLVPRLPILDVTRGGEILRAVMLVEKVTYFGEFSYLNGSCIRIKYYYYVYEFFER